MKVQYSKSFVKTVSRLSGKQLTSVREVIVEVKNAKRIEDITDCKRLIGYNSVYRIRIGGMRAFFILVIEDTVCFQYLVSRGQAYSKKIETELKRLDS